MPPRTKAVAKRRATRPSTDDAEVIETADTKSTMELLRSIGDHIDTRRTQNEEGDEDDVHEVFEDGDDREVPVSYVNFAATIGNAEDLEERSARVATQQTSESDHLFVGHNRNSVACVCAHHGSAVFYADKLGVVTRVTFDDKDSLPCRSLLLPHPESPVCSMAISNTSNQRQNVGMARTTADLSVTAFVAVGLRSGMVRIWNASTLEHVGDLTLHRSAVTGLVFRTGTSVLVSVSEDKVVRTWSVHHMSSLDKYYGHSAPIQAVSALRGERAVTCGDDRIPRYWKLDKATQIAFAALPSPGDAVALVDDDCFVVGTRTGSLVMYDTMKRSPVWSTEFAHGYGWGGDGTGLERGHRTFTEKFGTAEPPAKAQPAFGNPITALATLPYSDVLASGSCDGFVRLWKIIRAGEDPDDPRARRLEFVARVAVFGFVNDMAFRSTQELLCGIGKEPRLGRWQVIRAARNGLQRVLLSQEVTERRRGPARAALPAANHAADAAHIASIVSAAKRPTEMMLNLEARRLAKSDKSGAKVGKKGNPRLVHKAK